MIKYNYLNNNHCKCGKLITNNAKNCKKCNRLGKKYKHPKTCKCPFCKTKRKEYKHPKNCQCASCKSMRGEMNDKNNPNFKNGQTLKKYYCKTCDNQITFSSAIYGQGNCRKCADKEHSLLMKNNWKNREFKEKRIKATLKSSRLKPNKSEKKLNGLLNRLFPNEYKINVKGEVMVLGGKIPDFINCNGQKKIIELFGDYWHSDKVLKEKNAKDSTEKGRIKYFKKLGYSTLIIWEHELEDTNRLTNKLKEFNNV